MSGLRMGTVTPGRKRARRKRGQIIRRGVNHTHQSTTELQTSTSCVVYCLNMMFLDGIWRHATPASPPTRSHLSPNPTITIIASFSVPSIPRYQNSFHHRHFHCSLQARLLQLSLSQPAQVSNQSAPTDPELSCTCCCKAPKSSHITPILRSLHF